MSLGRATSREKEPIEVHPKAKHKQSQVQEQEPIRQPKPQTVDHYEGVVRGLGSHQDTDGVDESINVRGNNGSGPLTHRAYDPANFIVPGSDAQGHSERIQCRVPPGMLRQISAIVASKKFPFRTDGDVYRWAVWIGIQLLDRLEPTPNTFICRVDAANAIIREQIYLQEYQETLTQAERVVQQYVSTGARNQAVKMIAQLQHQYSKIEETYWRDRLLREVKERFGHLMGGVETAKLGGDE